MTADREPNKVIYSMMRVGKVQGTKKVLQDISLSYFHGAKIGVLGAAGLPESALATTSGHSVKRATGIQLYTLRGAEVRDAKAWSHYINEAIEIFSDDAQVLFASHTWPIWGNEELVTFLGETDMVEFAKWRPGVERRRALLVGLGTALALLTSVSAGAEAPEETIVAEIRETVLAGVAGWNRGDLAAFMAP